jgi:glycosyltransferase involved in cell wall biosynthesis
MSGQLRILHFSTADMEGGSARSAWRIHTGLISRGHDSRMLVRSKSSSSDRVRSVAPTSSQRLLDRAGDWISRKSGLQYHFLPSSLATRRDPWLGAADIVQLFNTHGGYVSQGLLRHLGRSKPVVWRLSDLWPLTGHCAYPGDCEGWRSGCGNCPDLATYPPVSRDRTDYLWQEKRRMYAEFLELVMVAPSSWTARLVSESPLFTDREILRIPNGLDLAFYSPGNRSEARDRLGIPHDKILFIFNAHVAANNPRKGTHLLMEAMQALPEPDKVGLLVVGQGAEWWNGRIPQTAYPLGFLQSVEAVRTAYLAADAAVVPSTVENLPNSLLEAIACGLPAVAFDAGGMGDAVVDSETGFLANVGNVALFVEAMDRLRRDAAMRATMGAAARRLAEVEFDQAVEADRFEALYQRILERRHNG